ncbi:hypothetical protein [Phytomonospora endophytica]|uniref:UbiC transcription regulator-associated domain-containing protein n=1 Tax=Phytomonospora endophytica TaxID=714109 RepID=A0A841G170_9ACTN|nr:hypothetical protein [Phytomonospora endophytica]MBB6037910.1 hypothetical protein [Phytomonospora endophytica]
MVLANDGGTTTLLAAVLDTPLGVVVHRLEDVGVTEVAKEIRDVLDPQSRHAHFALRQASLATPTGQPVSHNLVIWRLGADPRLDTLARDETKPIGLAIADAGLILRRHAILTGLDTWQPDGRPCVVKTYLLADPAAQPVMWIREHYNPAIIPSTIQERCSTTAA